MMIPALELGQTEGLNAYPKPPAIADDVKNADGNTGSSRTQIITYIASDAGTYTIPAISLGWFDLDLHAAKTASLPATVLTVANVPTPTQAIAPELQTQDSTAGPSALSKTTIALVMGALCLIAGISWLVRRLMPSINARLSAWRDAHRNSEKCASRSWPQPFERMIRQPSIGGWRCGAGVLGSGSIGDWVSDSHDMNVAREIGTLERGLFAGARDGSAFDRAALLRAITAVRHIHIRPQRSRDSSRLPPLNPAGRPLGVTPPVSKGYTG
ncbi:BatD family protein [Rhizobium sp. RCAM05350]|nr:BatD family protein [Rhizobium sp. RCAM05350]